MKWPHSPLAFRFGVVWLVLLGGLREASADYQSEVLSDAPTAYWRLGESAGTVVHDLVGEHGGLCFNTVWFTRAGALAGDADTACGFDGKTGYVEVPYSADLNGASFSVECWARANGGTGTRMAVSSTDTNGGYNLTASFGNLWTFETHAPGAHNWVYGPSIVTNQWTHLVGTFDGSNKCLYVNGVLAEAKSEVRCIPNAGRPLHIGEGSNEGDPSVGSQFYFPGDVDEVAVYNYVLPAKRVALHYQTGKYYTNTPPFIVQEGISQQVVAGAPALLSVNPGGSPPLGFQWWKDGLPVPGATCCNLLLSKTVFSDSSTYFLSITNALGATNSQGVRLAVYPAPLFCNVTNGLVLHLKFDGDCQDSSGRTNHGRAVGSPVFTQGKIGTGALRYNTDFATQIYNYVTLGTPTDLLFSSNVNFSVAYWVKFSGSPGDLPFLCNALNSFGQNGFTFAPGYNFGGWSWSLGGWKGTGWFTLCAYGKTNSINDGNWHHLVHTFDRAGLAMTFLDGVQAGCEHIAPVGNIDTGKAVNIGQDPTGRYAESAVIELDDLGIWRRALSSYEAESIYTVGQTYGQTFDTYGPVQITVQRSGTSLEIIWQGGTLEMADQPTGPWQPVSGASAPYCRVPANEAGKFFRIRL